ncbi:DinB family protein [Isoptericola sp. b515]|uniref:DinB family protein n=1 Tax=Isoptericola sp. b515 TaxID=3064652 RepID=UPI0027122293|nr:DinB family protein [Isoptericola sp. b515]MDO8147842.1 DinB family protein [Isoptericola sp. b515]
MDTREMLLHYLHDAREALVWKTEGLSERELRMPRTTTGTNLLGLVKHAASTEVGYFGEVFGRPWPTPDEIAWTTRFDTEPNGDFFATTDESAEQILDLYRRVAAFADETIESLPLDAPGHVPWWGDRGGVTLERVVVHVLADLQRHAGHADILREGIDGAVGLLPRSTNIPDVDQAAYVARLRAIAEQFPA